MMKKFAKWLEVLLMICLMLTACTPAGTAGGGSETVLLPRNTEPWKNSAKFGDM